jgi:hypothetical protein
MGRENHRLGAREGKGMVGVTKGERTEVAKTRLRPNCTENERDSSNTNSKGILGAIKTEQLEKKQSKKL